LRDRTDELELIISSLTTFALFTLPGWLFERYADVYTQLSVTFVAGCPTCRRPSSAPTGWPPRCSR